MIKEKVQALKALLGGDDELVQLVLDQAEAKEKEAQSMGVAFKEEGEAEPETPAAAPAVPIVDEKADDMEDDTEDSDEDDMPVIGDMSPDEFAGMLAEAMGRALEPYQAEIKALKVSMTKKDDSEAALREALEAQAATIKELKSQLDELTGSQPRASAKGYRDSQSEATVVKENSRVKGQKPTVDPAFIDMVIGPK